MPAVAFLVVAEVGDGDAGDVVGFREFWAGGGACGSGGRVVDEFVFVEFAVRAVFELFVEEDILVASHLEKGTASEGGVGGEDFDEVVVAADGAAGVGDGDIEEEFALAGGLTFGAIDGDTGVSAAVEGVGAEVDVIADAAGLVAAALTAFEADASVVIDIAFAVDDGGLDAVVAHDLCGGVHEGAVGVGGDEAEVVPAVGGGGVVIDLAECSGGWACGGPEGDSAEGVGAAEVVLDDGACGLAGDDAFEAAVGGGGHGSGLEGGVVDGIEERERGDVIWVRGESGDGDGLGDGRDGGGVSEA